MASSSLKHSLKVLAQNLGMPHENERKARIFINRELFERLENNPNKSYKINRCRILGSTGKRTGVWVTMDIDCVIFVNQEHPRNLSEYSRHITMIQFEWRKVLESQHPTLKNTARGMKLDFEGMEIELLVAFDTTGRTPDSYGNLDDQRAGVAKSIDKLPPEMDKRDFSRKTQSSLNEISASIVRSQSAVTHELIRLAKLWVYFTPPPQYYVCAKSYMIEWFALLAMESARNADKYYDLFECLKRFLALLSVYEQVETGGGNNQRAGTSNGFTFIDPSNPAINLADVENSIKFLEHCKSFALGTLENVANIQPVAGEEDWLTWLKVLYVKESDRRHSLASTLGKNRLHVVGPVEETCFPQLIQWPGKDRGNRNVKKYEDLMKFVCFNAAFIPKEKLNDFDDYVNCLKQCLQFTAGIDLQRNRYASSASGGISMNFIAKYPVTDGKAVHILASLD